MTEKQLGEQLHVLRCSQAEMELLENQEEPQILLRFGSRNQTAQMKIITSSLSILNEKERFIIESHLINQKTWKESVALFEKQWGTENSRCTRTLMRLQRRALQKMVQFINKFKIGP